MGVGDASFTVVSLKETIERIRPSLSQILGDAEPYAASYVRNSIELMEMQIQDLVRTIGKSDRE